MPLMNIFTFLTFIRLLAIPSDDSAALFKQSFTFVAIYAEEDYSILTETSKKVFKSTTTNSYLFLNILERFKLYSLLFIFTVVASGQLKKFCAFRHYKFLSY